MMKKLVKLILIVTFMLSNVNATPKGKMTGGLAHEMPEWFKDSFLELQEDAAEAKEKNKHVMLFFSLENCPYCTKMLNKSFTKGTPIQSYIEENFDVIGIDIKGSREIVINEDTTLIEKEYAKKLKVQYTPAIIFLDENSKVVVRINGYRSPENFKHILDFVQTKSYKKMTLIEFVNKVKSKTLYKLKKSSLFTDIKDLSKIEGALALIFEDGSCTQCDYMHNVTLKNKDVIKELKKFTIVRLDANSDEKITDVDGNKISPKNWAKKLKLDYRPGILLFNEKEEIMRIDALLYSFHFKELFRYVSGKHYETYTTFIPYLGVRQKELLNKGVNIDISDK